MPPSTRRWRQHASAEVAQAKRRAGCSSIALFVALGGTGYAAMNAALPANSVGTKQIKNGAVTQAKIKPHSLGAHVINVNKLGKVPTAAMADSATSAMTATTAITATNATNAGTATTATTATTAITATTASSAPIAKVTYVVTTSAIPASATPTTPLTISATCPSGTTVISGGAQMSDEASGFMNDTYPTGKTGWAAAIVNSVGSTNLSATVTAICAPAAATAP